MYLMHMLLAWDTREVYN